MKTMVFDRKSDLPGVIVLSHGPMALSLLESLKVIAGDVENCAAISIEAGDDPEELREKLEDVYRQYEKAIILVDLMAGTPFNQACLSARAREEKTYIASGVNMPMLIEVASCRKNTEMAELLVRAVKAGKDGTVNVTQWMEERFKK